jgi:hypothetical protein
MAAPAMGEGQPFIGSEALAAGLVSRHELRRYYRAVMPNVYLDKRAPPSPRETASRRLLNGAGYPRPRTQIPVISADGRRKYHLDMG